MKPVLIRESKIRQIIHEEFKKHMMYDPNSSKKKMTQVEKDHEDLGKKGYIHLDPKELRKILKDEGGAAGIKPFTEKFGKEREKEIRDALEVMDDVGLHKDGDYILQDDAQIKIEQIIREEIENLIEEGLMQDIAAKASNTLKALALSATMGAAGTAAAQPAGVLQSTETPITSTSRKSEVTKEQVTRSIVDRINKSKFKDKYDRIVEVSPDDVFIERIGEAVANLYNKTAPADKTISQYENVAMNALSLGFKKKHSEYALYRAVAQIVEDMLKEELKKKRSRKPSISLRAGERRDNITLVSMSARNVMTAVATRQSKRNQNKAFNKLKKNLIRAVKDGEIPKEKALKVFDIVKDSSKSFSERANEIDKLIGAKYPGNKN